MVNFKKSVSTPTQQLGHLGFVLNIRTMTASLPMKELRDIRRSINWQNQRIHDYWTPIKAAQSINWRELKAARLALKTFRVPKNSTIFIRTGNTTSLSYINKHGGTHSLPLLELATEVWNWCLRHNIMIQTQHISGIYSTIADMESRRTYFKNQWRIKPSVFEELNKIWGPFTINLFADRTMKLLPSSGGLLLAQCDLVPPVNPNSPIPSITPSSSSSSNDISQDDSPSTFSELDALRVAIIWNKPVKANLNEQAIQDLLTQKLASSPTNKAYRKNQLRFLEWANHNQVSYTAFSGDDLINFLAAIRQTHNFQVATLKSVRVAVAHLHDNPPGTSEASLVNSYLDSLSRQAPPISIHREQVDMTPSLDYARSIPSQPDTSIKLLQQKLAFLLAMVAFLRPSDLAQIPFSSCEVHESDGYLKFQVVSPKETRKKRRIVKPFTVHPHTRDQELCPVQCFKALRDHPDLQAHPTNSTLFIKSNNIRQSLSASTLSSWLHRELISLSTSESRVSIHSLTSFRALDQGIPMDHIVTLGNWVSSSTFQDHYQRNQMAMIDFTSTVLSGSNDDEFFDASDNFSLD
ncbi:hypothetical protein G6F37_006510 [Rhizopus arrhizus]|nr:hypothetical protein G6F38_006851 [Rhizopus arrhizus]KAG1157647.1 hypothetical protein G6F37_006510 [Rhizopus arrhizus]